ncbi:hypothetical protein T11_4967, partial [Trichinella zimbabwensis]
LSWYEVFASRLTSLNPASYAVGASPKTVSTRLAVDLEIEERKRQKQGKGWE